MTAFPLPHADFYTLAFLLCDGNDEFQKIIVQIVSLRQTEKQFLLCAVHEFVSVLIVCVG